MAVGSARAIGCITLVVTGLVGGCTGTYEPQAHLRALHRSERCVRADHVSTEEPDEPLGSQDVPDNAPADVARLLRAARLPLTTIRDRADLFIRLLVLKTQVSAAQAYLDCLGDAIEDHLRREVLEKRDRAELHLTLASVGVGAAAAIAAGVIELYDANTGAAPIVGIAGGAASAALGAWALMLPAPTLRLEHEINVLRAIWYGEPRGGLPPFVWRLLNAPRQGARSPRETLRSQWAGMLAQHDPERRARLKQLLFGKGGRYDLNALQLRETMLDQLETEIDLMNPEFQRMVEFVEARVQTDPVRGGVDAAPPGPR
jgi:hypothetical protein